MITLSNDQERVVQQICDFLPSNKPEFTVRGHAGTGKTFSLQYAVRESPHLRWAFTAPTNKATRVLKSMAAGAGVVPECSTSYSLLGLRLDNSGEVKRIVGGAGRSKARHFDVVVVDEASQVNKSLRREILHAAKEESVKIVYMGDPLQLPPVNETHSTVFDVEANAVLTEIVRQAKGNPIISATGYIRECILKEEYPRFETRKSEQGGVFMLPHDKWLHWLKSGFNSTKYQEDSDQFKAVAWTNKTVNMLNRHVRGVLYPDRFKTERFIEGERVIAKAPVFYDNLDESSMMTDEEAYVERIKVMPHPLYKHMFKVYGLELLKDDGQIITACVIHEDSIDDFNKEVNRRAAEAKKNKALWRSFWEFKDLFADIVPCHSITAHRSQGSTYNNVFVHMGDILENRRKREALQCLYVALSRASQNTMLTMG